MTIPPILGTPPLLVGRDRELGVLREHLAAAFGGRGNVVLIGGEAGIGKTALAEVLCREARKCGALVLVGRCYDLTETPPYGPWVELFAAYDPAGGVPLPEAFAERGTVGAVASQPALMRQVGDFLAALASHRPARPRPVVLLLDDLHWADVGSLDLLRFVARTVVALPLLVIVAYRSDEITRRHALYPLLPILVREAGAERIEVRRLDDDAMRALIVSRYRLSGSDTDQLVAFIQSRAEGNALFAGEVLRSLAETDTLHQAGERWTLGDLRQFALPPLLRQVIDGRIARLDAETQRLLPVAAAVGQEVPLTVLGRLAELDEETLLGCVEAAAAASILTETADGLHVRFAHALIREALYEGIYPARRRLLHRRIAELLAEQPRPDPDAVAMHFQRASDPRAIAWLVRAGERAHLAYARQTAAERYEAALALLEASDGDLGERGWLRYRIARMRRGIENRQSIEYLDEALRIAAVIEDRALAAAARYTHGFCLLYDGEDGALDEMTAGCDLLEALSPDDLARMDLGPDDHGLPTVTNARGFLIMVLVGIGRANEAIAMGESARDGKPRNRPLADMAWQNYGDRDNGLGQAYAIAGRPAEARAAFERARARYRAVGNYGTGNSIAIEVIVCWLPYFIDRPADVEKVAEMSAAAYRWREDKWYEHLASLPLFALAGRWDAAKAGAETALSSAQLPFRPIAALVVSGIAHARGEWDAAWAYINTAQPSGPDARQDTIFSFIGVSLAQGAARLSLDMGDLARARRWLDAQDRWLAASEAVLGQSEGQVLWAQYYLQAGDGALARQHAERALAHATDPRQPLALLAAHRLLGELDTDAAHHDDAARHLDASVRLADACHAPYERALTLLALAELHAVRGAVETARATLEEVRAICTPLDAKPALARAAALLARLAAPREASPAYPAGLSAREVEVLRLVAQGLMNAEVAERLFLSPRTVEQHLRSIYNKLGVSSRTAATRVAVERGLT